MPVVGIRKRQGLDQVFVAGYEAVAHRLVHQGSGPGPGIFLVELLLDNQWVADTTVELK